MKQNVKRLPYGINDFEAVMEQNHYCPIKKGNSIFETVEL